MTVKELKTNNMAGATAGILGGGNTAGNQQSGGGIFGASGILDRIKAAQRAQLEGAKGGGGIGEAMMNAAAGASGGARVKTNMAAEKMAGGTVPTHGEEAHTGGAGPVGRKSAPLFYKMKASGAKYKNNPINKNFGDAEARGFAPTKMSTFGVGSKEKQGGVGSEMEPPLKLMGLVKGKVNKELESPAGQMFAKAAMGGV